jgi:hypothetical protein
MDLKLTLILKIIQTLNEVEFEVELAFKDCEYQVVGL